MRILGFGNASTQHEEIHTMDKLEEAVRKEIYSLQEFEQKLSSEIKEVEDLKNNFQLVKSQLESIKILAIRRDKTITLIFEQHSRVGTDADIDKVREYYKMVSYLDSQLDPMINKAFDELQRLLITEASIIYKNEKNGKSIMEIIDKEARQMRAELKVLSLNIASTRQEVSRIGDDFRKAENERKLRNVRKRAGF